MKTINQITSTQNLIRIRLLVQGAVQGVGFRPFVYRLAREMSLTGWVSNSPEGLIIEVEGSEPIVDEMVTRLKNEAPPSAVIQSVGWVPVAPEGSHTFEIKESEHEGEKITQVLPDLNICPDCLADISDPANRRYQYAFTNCTQCGPRFSIIEGLPYDRPFTCMRKFEMCDPCRREYENPSNRRFHAQPNACPVCGPELSLWDKSGNVISHHHEALIKAAEAIRSGLIVAIKGIGGFHLFVDARSDKAVKELRLRKHRAEKPFALMFPSLASLRFVCEVSKEEEYLLRSAAAPIVILNRIDGLPSSHRDGDQMFGALLRFFRSLKKRSTAPSQLERLHISYFVAPENPTLGVMLPYSPLHALLLKEIGFPVVATSGNLSEEPICFDENEVLNRLGNIADLFLVHNRPIVRPMDDSVARIMMGHSFILRAGRGLAPVSLDMGEKAPGILGVGGHLKNTVAVSAGNSVFVSQHLGDLASGPSYEAFQAAKKSMTQLYELDLSGVAHDLHPDYYSTTHAKEMNISTVPVQHHHAHIVSCMAEHGLKGRVFGVAWDGTGFGLDDTIWGGEFLVANRTGFNRVGYFSPFLLPGGESAIREPRRSALGLLFAIFGSAAFEKTHLAPFKDFNLYDLKVLKTMMENGVNAPLTSSVGRIFDGVSSLLDLKQTSEFEGQAAMALEFVLHGIGSKAHYSIPVEPLGNGSYVLNWKPMVQEILGDLADKVSRRLIALKFHNALAESAVSLAQIIKIRNVVLSGGCFQNKYLLERTAARLDEEGFRAYWPERLPANDGGLSFGQVAVAAARLKESN